MKVTTQSPKLAKLRRGVMELYISDHPLDCLTCPANGDCELQDMAGAVGLREVRYGYEGANHLHAEKDKSQPVLRLRPLQVHRLLALRARLRGGAGHLRADHQGPRLRLARSRRAGRCFRRLRVRVLRRLRPGLPDRHAEGEVGHRARPAGARVVTTCAYCGVGCAFKAEMRGNEVVRMVPYKDGKANQGHSCVKGRFAWGYATHQDRILKPMIREQITDPWQRGDLGGGHRLRGRRVQAHPGRVRARSIGGITSSRCTNEEVFLVQKMVRAALRQQQRRHLRPRLPLAHRLRPQADLRHLRRHPGLRLRGRTPT